MRLTRRQFAVGAVLAPTMLRAHNGEFHGTVHEVMIERFEFAPETLSVAVGDRIRFTNNDVAPHTATATDESWDTGRLNRGDSAEIDIVDGMTATYFCRFHPNMKAAITLPG